MFIINAKIRKDKGKGASRRLRLTQKLPAIIYGGNEAPIAIELNHDTIFNIQTKERFYTDVLTLIIDGKENIVKVKAVQRHFFKPKVTHVDFVRA